MYIRRARTRSNATGEHYFSYRLVRSERMGGKVKQVTLLNLGRHFPVDRPLWPALCARIEALMAGQASFFEVNLPTAAAVEAERIVAQLQMHRVPVASASATQAETAPADEVDIQAVDVNSLELVRPRSVGVEHTGLWAMSQVGFTDLLIELGLSGPIRAAILGAIIGRMAAPGSELAAHHWLDQCSGLGELLDIDFGRMPLMTLYRAQDALMKHKDRIERTLFNRVHNLFGLDTTVTLFDLTNTYFEGVAGANPEAKRGRSKEKRSDCPLVTLGLVLDGSGFVRRSEVFEGNVSEGKTLEVMLKGLDAEAGALVVMDAGIATEDNLRWLREQGYRYLVVSRERARQFEAASALPIENAAGKTVSIQRVDDEDNQEVRLYCYSAQREQKEAAINQHLCQRFEAALQKIADGLTKPRTEKRLVKLHERIGRLKANSQGIAQHYDIELLPDASGEKVAALRWTKQPRAGTRLTHPGVYCLRSNETGWDSERLWRTYIMLTDLEAVFRSLKSELGLRPVYHHKKLRVDGHLFITVLAYQFVQIIRRTLQDHGIQGRWSSLREILSVQRRLTASFRRADGGALHVRKATRPESALAAIYQALNIDPLPGGVQKTVV
ncbi:IS1634 family transposase [Nitrosomonas halophila]|uniref:Transposase n=1 Tax=Nitrosomonas halophila TaxID=44576 RepID=A0A1H3KC22_9PROT|nr:IS1634 family transposase [Nitrosomonas halophila]SDY49710.1 Transposase [Nitrosomonas halophila]